MHEIPTPRGIVQKMFLNSAPLFLVLIFQVINNIQGHGQHEGKPNMTQTMKSLNC